MVLPTPRDIGVLPVFGGRSTPAASFLPHSQRWFNLTIDIDYGNMMTLGPRMEAAIHVALIKRIEEAATYVLAQSKLRLQPGHGYDTGLMYDSLVATLVSHFEEGQVAYDLEAPEAPYWVYVEFGHMTRGGNWWEGYHFLSGALADNWGYVVRKANDAVRDAIVVLAMEARYDIPGMPGI